MRFFTHVFLMGTYPARRALYSHEDPPPFPEFTFKMGKPPEKGTKKRITVQIEPEAEPAPNRCEDPRMPHPRSPITRGSGPRCRRSCPMDGAERLALAMQSARRGA